MGRKQHNKEARRAALIRNEHGRLLCPYCDQPAVLKSVTEVYGGRHFGDPDKKLYVCQPCDAYVGCHPGTEKPLGNLADAATRLARRKAHAAFDPLWQAKQEREGCSKGQARGKGYAWLAGQMGIPPEYCHISWMDTEAAEQVAAICAPFYRRRDA